MYCDETVKHTLKLFYLLVAQRLYFYRRKYYAEISTDPPYENNCDFYQYLTFAQYKKPCDTTRMNTFWKGGIGLHLFAKWQQYKNNKQLN